MVEVGAASPPVLSSAVPLPVRLSGPAYPYPSCPYPDYPNADFERLQYDCIEAVPTR
jgi:hypothetical protein